MNLTSTPLDPVPQGARTFTLQTQDGVTLRVATVPPLLGPARGTMVLAQGRTEFIEKYFEVIGELRGRGFHVVTFDWRGQGLSDRLINDARKGHVAAFSDYDQDIETVMAQHVLPFCPQPVFALAHSMGGAIMLRALAHHPGWFKRAVLNAPMIDLHPRLTPRLMAIVAEWVTALGLGAQAVPRPGMKPEYLMGFDNNSFTHDPARFERVTAQIMANPRLGIAAPTWAWARAASRAMQDFSAPAFAARVQTPVLLIGAGDDTIVSTPAIAAMGERLPQGQSVIIEGARHEIMLEGDLYRHQFWAAFDAFMAPDKPDA